MSVTTAQAISLLENVLFETKTAATANAASWVSLSNLNSSYSTVSGLAGAMSQTAEAGIAEQVIRYYEGALGRAPAAAEVAYYVNIIENGNAATGIPAMTTTQISEGAVPGATWNTIASFFAASPEFAFASAGSNVVNLLYLNILGRAPNAAEVTYYQNLLASGTTVSTLVQYFTTSPEFQTKVNAQIQTGIANYGASVTTGGSATGPVVPVLTGGSGNNTSVALTTGVDSPAVGGNVTINGTANGATATFTAGDQIIGTGANNILNIADLTTGGTWAAANGTNIPGITVSGVQTASFTSGEAVVIDTSSASLEGFTGLTTLNVKNVGTATVTAASTTAINETDLSSAATTISVQGGANVTVVANAVTLAGTVNVGTVTAATGAVSVTTNELASQTTGVADAINVKGGTTVSVTANLTGALNNTITGGAIGVTGTSTTTSVSVTQTAKATASGTVSGVTDGAVTITDVNGASTTKAGTITTVSLTDFASATITDNALTTLTLAGTGGVVALTDNLTTPTVTSLALNVNGLSNGGLNDTAGELTTINVVTGGKSGSSLALTDAGLKTLAVSGSQHLTVTGAAAPTTLTVSGAAGVTATVGATETFTSTSTGTDIISITAAATKAITGNGTAGEEIVWNADAAPVSTAYLGTVTGFKILGLGGTVATTTNDVFDMSKITGGFTGFDVQANANANTIQIVNAAAGSTLQISGNLSGALVFATADTAGPTDTVSVTLGTATSGVVTAASLTLEDSALNGLGTVKIGTGATTTTAVNTLTNLNDASLTSLTVSGAAGLTVSSAFTDTVKSLTITNSITGTKGITFGGGISDTSLTSLTLSGSGKGAFALGTVTHSTSGIAVTGVDQNTTLVLAGATKTGAIDSVTLGNGNDTVTDTAALAGASVNITLGNGTNTVTVGINATNTVVVGTGANSVIESAAGGNLTATFGAHSVATIDNVSVGAATSATVAPTAVITGLNISGADTITFLGDTGSAAGVTLFTSAQINTLGSNPTSLAAAVNGVLSAGGALAQHAVGEFVFQGNTYFVEQAGVLGTAFAAGDTLVELTGVQTVTAATTAAAGVLHLHG